MRLFELFDQQYAYTWNTQDQDIWRGYFTTKTDDRVRVNIEEREEFGEEDWHIVFSREQEHDVTGGGDAIKIFSTVIAMTEDFIQAMKPPTIKFNADKSEGGMSRSRLYNRLIKRFAGKNGYTYDITDLDDGVVYNLIRKDKKI